MVGQHSPLVMSELRRKQLDLSPLTDIRRALFRFRTDPEFRGDGQRVPLRQFAELCGVSRQCLYDIMCDKRIGLEPHTKMRILTALDLVLNKGLRWQRKATKAVRGIIVPASINWIPVMPNGEPPPPIPKRNRGHDHSNL